MRKYIALILALLFVLSLVGCSDTNTTFDIGKASKIELRSGDDGTMVEITDADDIKYITDNINAIKFSKGNEVNSDGWTYSLCWYDENGNSIEKLTLKGDGYTVVYDGYYYKGVSIDYEIDLEFLANQFVE